MEGRVPYGRDVLRLPSDQTFGARVSSSGQVQMQEGDESAWPDGEARAMAEGMRKEPIVKIKATKAMTEMKVKLQKKFGIVEIAFGWPTT